MEQTDQLLAKLYIAVFALKSIVPPHKVISFNRMSTVIVFLQGNLELIVSRRLVGRKLATRVLEILIDPIAVEITEDYSELIALPPGWCDTEASSTSNISEDAFTVGSLLMLLFYLLPLIPDTVIPSPQQTINFKFGSLTLIVNGTEKLKTFDRETCKSTEFLFGDSTSWETHLSVSATMEPQNYLENGMRQLLLRVLVPELGNAIKAYRKQQNHTV